MKTIVLTSNECQSLNYTIETVENQSSFWFGYVPIMEMMKTGSGMKTGTLGEGRLVRGKETGINQRLFRHVDSVQHMTGVRSCLPLFHEFRRPLISE